MPKKTKYLFTGIEFAITASFTRQEVTLNEELSGSDLRKFDRALDKFVKNYFKEHYGVSVHPYDKRDNGLSFTEAQTGWEDPD